MLLNEHKILDISFVREVNFEIRDNLPFGPLGQSLALREAQSLGFDVLWDSVS
jgi:hypothetical protein